MRNKEKAELENEAIENSVAKEKCVAIENSIAKEKYVAKERFATLKKDIKNLVKEQSERMVDAMVLRRGWEQKEWETVFIKNPIMRSFAFGIIWGIYEEDKLIESFRYMEDGTYSTVEEEEYTIPKQKLIYLVHPVDLGEDICNAFNIQLEDYEIKQLILQLQRPIYSITKEEENAQSMKL